MKNLKNRNYSEELFETNRRVVKLIINKPISFKDYIYQHKDRHRYLYRQYDVNEYLVKSLISNDDYEYYHKSWAGFDNFTSENYGITWIWYTRKLRTVIIDKRPNWKLTSKAKKQYQGKKYKIEKDKRFIEWKW